MGLRPLWFLVVVAVSVAVVQPSAESQSTPSAPAVVPASFSFEVVPGLQFGPIRETTSRAALSKLLPARSVEDAEIYIAEGFCTPGVRIFGGTADQIELGWQTPARARVAFVRAVTPGGRWKTRQGVSIGTRLTELERLAGGVLTFSGFGWDYGGGMSWTESGRTIGLRLGLEVGEAGLPPGSDARAIVGDRLVRSDHPIIRASVVRVEQLLQTWGTLSDEQECRGL
jgi:hypothetical protein